MPFASRSTRRSTGPPSESAPWAKVSLVGPVRIAAGLRFDKVFLVGMVEGLVPAQPPDDPLLPLSEREMTGLLFHSAAAERYDYLAAAAAGHTRLLTFARGNNIAMREQHPSRWFLDEASCLYGSPVYPSMLSNPRELAQLREQPLVRRGGFGPTRHQHPVSDAACRYPRLRSAPAFAVAAGRQRNRRPSSRPVRNRFWLAPLKCNGPDTQRR